MNESKPKGEKDSVASFLTVYNNLPLGERHRVILVLENQPITWDVARSEIVNKTERGNTILAKLVGLGII